MGKNLTDQGKERKQQLLDCAAELFSANGYDNTRIIDICDAAGVAKGLFYWYFENKDALFVELVDSMRLRLRQTQGKAMADADDPLTRLKIGTGASLEFMAEHGSYFRFLDTELNDPRMSARLRGGNEVYVTDVVKILSEGVRRGMFVDADPRVLAVLVVSTVNQFSQMVRSDQFDLSVEQATELAGAWLEGALTQGRVAVTSHVADGITTPTGVS